MIPKPRIDYYSSKKAILGHFTSVWASSGVAHFTYIPNYSASGDSVDYRISRAFLNLWFDETSKFEQKKFTYTFFIREEIR